MHDLSFDIEAHNVAEEWDAPPYIDPMAVLTEAARRREEELQEVIVEEYKFEPFLHPMMDSDG